MNHQLYKNFLLKIIKGNATKDEVIEKIPVAWLNLIS